MMVCAFDFGKNHAFLFCFSDIAAWLDEWPVGERALMQESIDNAIHVLGGVRGENFSTFVRHRFRFLMKHATITRYKLEFARCHETDCRLVQQMASWTFKLNWKRGRVAANPGDPGNWNTPRETQEIPGNFFGDHVMLTKKINAKVLYFRFNLRSNSGQNCESFASLRSAMWFVLVST